MTVIASGSLSGTAVNLTSIPGTYVSLYLVVRGFRTSTDNFDLRMRFNNDSNANRYFNTANDQTSSAFNGDSVYIATGQDDATTNSLCAVTIFDYTNTVSWKIAKSQSVCNLAATPANVSTVNNNCYYNQTGAITEVNIISTGTAFATGTYTLYGVK